MNVQEFANGGGETQVREVRKSRLPPPNPDFAHLVVKTREQVAMSQAELAQAAGVAPRTVAEVEKRGTARVEVIIRIAAALGQRPDEWLRMVGHTVSNERIRDVLNLRQRDKGTPTFARLDPGVQFERMLERVRANKGALMCSFVTSPTPIDRDDLLDVFRKMFAAGLHLALICPFPVGNKDIILKRSRLGRYYLNAYEWALTLAKGLGEKCPAYRHQISVFTPASVGGGVLVAPPIRVSEVRPAFIKYGSGSESTSQYELGAYLRFLDGREDQWLEIYNAEGERAERAEETFGAWKDYCADIVDSWAPENADSTFDKKKLVFWERV